MARRRPDGARRQRRAADRRRRLRDRLEPLPGPDAGRDPDARRLDGSLGVRARSRSLVYSLGLAIPFLLTAIAFTRMTTAFGWVKPPLLGDHGAGGVILIAMGVLVFTGELTQLNIEAQQALDDLGINFFNEV